MKKTPVIILALALSVRVFFLVLDDGVMSKTGDERGYFAIAGSLLNGTGFSLDGATPTACRGPLYPLFVAAASALPFPDVRTIQILQIVVDCATCLLVWRTGILLAGETAGIAAGYLYAAYVPSALLCLKVLSEILFTFLLAAAIFLVVRRRGGFTMTDAGWAGFFIGLSVLARSNGIVVAVFCALWIIAAGRSPRKAALFAAACLLVMTPWIARNAVVFHRFIPTSTYTGLHFYNSYVFPAKGLGFNELKPEILPEYNRLGNEADRSAFLIRAAIAHIRDHPAETLLHVPMKCALLVYPFDMRWNLETSPVRYNPFWGIVACAALVGMWGMAPPDRRRFGIVFALLGALLLTAVVFYGSPRLRAPFDPFIILLAGAGIAGMIRGKRRYQLGVVIAVNAVLAAAGGIYF